MATITYTASRRIIPTHSASTTYSIEFHVTQSDKSVIGYVEPHESRNGQREVIRQDREDANWAVTVMKIAKANLPQWEEFFFSVIDGSVFYFDPYGTIASPDSVLAVVLTSSEFHPARKGTSDNFTLSFECREEV